MDVWINSTFRKENRRTVDASPMNRQSVTPQRTFNPYDPKWDRQRTEYI